MNLTLEHECPQCGAPVKLREIDRLLVCPYCRVRLLMHSPDNHYSYYFLPRAGTPSDFFFVPYWRFRGMKYTLSLSTTKHRFIDPSYLASNFACFPPSLGIRTQTLKMRFLESKTPGLFLRSETSLDEFVHRVEKCSFSYDVDEFSTKSGEKSRLSGDLSSFVEECRRSAAGKSSTKEEYQAFIGESTSLIFAPFYIKRGQLHDGMAGSSLRGCSLPEEFHEHLTRAPASLLRFWPALCPSCGWELNGDRESLVLFCKNCRTSWKATERGLERVEFLVLGQDSEADLWVPFWRLDVEIDGVELNSYADFAQLASIPRVVRPEMKNQPFFFWAAAFKIHPAHFLRVSRVMTMNQTESGKLHEFPRTSLYPVTLPADEALESVPVIFGSAGPVREKLFDLIRSSQFSLRDCKLVYAPLVLRGYDYLQPHTKVTIPANALKWGREL